MQWCGKLHDLQKGTRQRELTDDEGRGGAEEWTQGPGKVTTSPFDEDVKGGEKDGRKEMYELE